MCIIIVRSPAPRIMKLTEIRKLGRHTRIPACFARPTNLFNVLSVLNTVVTGKYSHLTIEQKRVKNHYLCWAVDIN